MKFNLKNFISRSFVNKSILFTNSGRAALQAAIKDFHLEETEMILPAFICEDVFSALFSQNQIKPILVDCSKNDFNISFNSIKKAYDLSKNRQNIKSILLVHAFGLMNKDIKKISNFCKKNKLILIEDCAHIININFNNNQIGAFGDAAIFSFSKILNVPIGGVYVKNKGKIQIKSKKYVLNNLDIYRFFQLIPFNRVLIKLLKSFKSKNKIKVNPSRICILAPPKIFDFFYFKPFEIDIERRKRIASILYEKLKDYSPKLEQKNNFFQSFSFLVENRDNIFKELNKNGIECTKMWTPILKSNKKMQNAELFSKKIINLRINPKWDNEEAEKIATKILNLVKIHSSSSF